MLVKCKRPPFYLPFTKSFFSLFFHTQFLMHMMIFPFFPFYICRFELGLEKPDPMRAFQSAVAIALSYIMGGLVPLLPYMVVPIAREAMVASVILTILALMIFGFAKGYFTGNQPFKSSIQTAFIGAVASAAAYSIAKVFRA